MQDQEIDKEINKKLEMLNESIKNISEINNQFTIECNSTISYIKYLMDLKKKLN